jgi:retrotransposon gag protein
MEQQDPNQHLDHLRQAIGNEFNALAAYIARFERILYEAHAHDWPDVTKISTFRKGLNQTLRNRLNQQLNLPRVYPEFLRIVQQLASYSGSSAPKATISPSSTSSYNDSDRMQIGQIRKADKYRELQEAEEPDTD